MSIEQFLLVCLLMLIVAPITIYLCVKFGTAAYYVGKWNAERFLRKRTSNHGE